MPHSTVLRILPLTALILPGCDRAAEHADYSPSYSPDGARIAFASDRTGNQDIFVVDVDGRNETRLTFETSNESSPAWSPDGRRIAFCSDRDGNQEIYVANADGSDPVNLTDHPAQDCNAAWSPDGTRILFMTTRDGDWRSRPEDNWEIYVMSADGSNQTRLTRTAGYDLSTGQAWSPDGSEIVFCSTMDEKFVGGPNRFDDFDLYIMNADGSEIRQLTSTPGQDSYAYWSADGERISYTHVDEAAGIEAVSGGQNYEIYTINPDGTGMTRLTNNAGFDFEGWWSPDSRRIVYASSQESPTAIYVMDRDGSSKTRITGTK